MEKELKELISKHLPQQMGEVLQERLRKADENESKVKSLEDQVSHFKSLYEKSEEMLRNYSDLKQREEKLKESLSTLEKEKRDLKVSQLEYQLVAEKEKSEFTKNVALGLVRNQEYRSDVFDNVAAPYTDSNGYQQYGNTTKTYHEVKIAH